MPEIDKGIPLMKPTFFDDNDPNNPKKKTYIEREALVEEMRTSRKSAFVVIAEAPTVDVKEVKHGYWIYHLDDLFPVESTQECSVCHEEEDITLCNDNFCPNCGAKMDGKEEG